MPMNQTLKKLENIFCKLFIEQDLELTIQCNRKVVNFLDVTLNFENSSYRPYLEDNNNLCQHRIIYRP